MWQAEVWHFLHVLRARKPKCCEVAGGVGYRHLYMCVMCTPTVPSGEPLLPLCVLLYPMCCCCACLFPCPRPSSPVPVERDPGRSWAAQLCFAGGGGEKGQCKCISFTVITFLSELGIYTWALVPSVPWLKNKQLFRWTFQVLRSLDTTGLSECLLSPIIFRSLEISSFISLSSKKGYFAA